MISSRTPLIAGNWKMHKNCGEAVSAAQRLVDVISGVSGIEVFIAPAFTSLYAVKAILKDSNIHIAAQDVFWEYGVGAFTGEISAEMLKDIGCEYIIIGHSERRQLFCETNEITNKKIKATLSTKLCPVLCVGETESDWKDGKTFSVVDKQIRVGLEGIPSNRVRRLVVAYEPVWAIGTGNTATNNQAQEVHSFIRLCLGKLYSFDLANDIRIIYGGSVNSSNIRQMMAMSDIDGALVGGASLEPDVFSELVCLAERSNLTERGKRLI